MGLTPDQEKKLDDAERYARNAFDKISEMWTAMFGHERDSVEKAQHREILSKLTTGGGTGSGGSEHQHTVHVTIDPT